MLVKLFQPSATCSPSARDDSYIYSILPTSSNGLAAITSADELLLLDRSSLQKTHAFDNVPVGVTCLQQGDTDGHFVLCSGRDGFVSGFDVRAKSRISHFKLGTELAHQQAIVCVWDYRQNKQRWQSTENNDDVTDLHFHSSRPNQLLTGGIDGLVSIFDTNIQDEDDSLLQVINHGPIHKAGFFSDEVVYALSHDERLALHAVSSQIDLTDTDDCPPVDFGDLRPILRCEYAIDVVKIGSDNFLAAGTHQSDPHVDLVQLQGMKDAHLLQDEAVRLLGAHSEEIVRSINVDAMSGTIFTAGEDGRVIAFRAQEETQTVKELPKNARRGSKNTNSIRYRPY